MVGRKSYYFPSFQTFFLPLFLLFPSSFLLLYCRPEAKAKVLFQTSDLVFVPDELEAFRSLFHNVLSNTTLKIIYVFFSLSLYSSPLSGLFFLPASHSCGHVFGSSPPCEVSLAAHRLEKSVVIRLVEKLHSADNPTEIAHGFPVPKVENKHTPLEYLMKGPENIRQ